MRIKILNLTWLVFAAGAPVLADVVPLALSLTGNVQMREEGDRYTDFSSKRNFMSLRIRPLFKYAVDPQVNLYFEPQFAKYLGEWASQTQRTSGVSYDTSVGFHEGYINYRPFEDLEFLLGRQILSYGDELVIGASNWGLVGRSFDALRASVHYSWGKTDVFYSKLADNNVTATGPGDNDLFGIYNSWSFGAGLRAVDLYFLRNVDRSSGKARHIEALGFRLKSDLKETSLPQDLDYRLEATQEFGNAVAQGRSAYQVDAELGYHFLAGIPLRLGLEAAIAGLNYNQLYPSPHRWLGYADLFGRQNINDWVVHLSSQATDKLSVSLDFHCFVRNSKNGSLVKTSGSAFVKPVSSSSNNIGSEWDLVVKQKLSPTLLASLGASLIQRGQYLQDQSALHPSFYYGMLEMNF